MDYTQIPTMVVDDHPIVLEGVKAVLGAWDVVAVVATAMNGNEALAAAASSNPAVVLLDLEIPPPAGVELIHALGEICAARILIMTVIDDDDRLVECMRAGASGYLLKGTPVDEMVEAIKLAHQGEVSLTPALTRRLLAKLTERESGETPVPATEQEVLTARERDVLAYVMRGNTNSEIASMMYLSPRTVKAHLATAFEKLGVHDRAAAVSVAITRGLITADAPDGTAGQE